MKITEKSIFTNFENTCCRSRNIFFSDPQPNSLMFRALALLAITLFEKINIKTQLNQSVISSLDIELFSY